MRCHITRNIYTISDVDENGAYNLKYTPAGKAFSQPLYSGTREGCIEAVEKHRFGIYNSMLQQHDF